MSAFRDSGARVDQPAWQYVLVSFFVGDLQTASDQLNELGMDGWEVVGVFRTDAEDVVYTLKRLRG